MDNKFDVRKLARALIARNKRLGDLLGGIRQGGHQPTESRIPINQKPPQPTPLHEDDQLFYTVPIIKENGEIYYSWMKGRIKSLEAMVAFDQKVEEFYKKYKC